MEKISHIITIKPGDCVISPDFAGSDGLRSIFKIFEFDSGSPEEKGGLFL